MSNKLDREGEVRSLLADERRRNGELTAALVAKDAEIARLSAQLAAVQDVVNLSTIRTRIDEAWVERICRALDATPASDGQGATDKANFAETQPIRYVRK